MNTPRYTKEVAARIALAGAKKMDAQGYTIEQGTFEPVSFIVNRPNDEGFYVVLPNSKNEGCDCAFYKSEGNCKHLCRVHQEIAKNEAAEAEADAERLEIEAETRQAIRDEMYAEF